MNPRIQSKMIQMTVLALNRINFETSTVDRSNERVKLLGVYIASTLSVETNIVN
jgi:hypothetical protein